MRLSRNEKIVYAILVLIGLAALSMAVFGKDAMPAIRRLKSEKSELQGEVDTLEKRQEELQKKTKLLQSDPRIMERRAREELGMVREGETVILIPEKGGNGKR